MRDEEAFAVAVYPLVRSLALTFAQDVRNVVEAEDLTQAGMIAALKLFRSRGGDAPLRLVNRAARFEMLDCVRSLTHRGKEQTEPLPKTGLEEKWTPALIPSPEPAIVRAIDVWRNVDALPERERQIAIGLSEGKTLAEIGRELKVHKTWIFHLKIRLRSHFRTRRHD